MNRAIEDEGLEYIRQKYQVPAKHGARVRFEGRPGTILGSVGPYLRIQLDGDSAAESLTPYHPTWHIAYDEEG